MNETTKKKQKEREAVLAKLDECGAEVLGDLTFYMLGRQKNVEDLAEHWNIGDPYLLGYARGLETGFKMAVDLVVIEATRAEVGDDPSDTDDQHFVKLGKAVDAINAKTTG